MTEYVTIQISKDVTIQISKDVYENLKSLDAQSSVYDEDFNAYEASGGNFDDAFELGQNEGEINLAQLIMASVKDED